MNRKAAKTSGTFPIKCRDRTVCRHAKRASSFLERLRGLQFCNGWPKGNDGLFLPRCYSVHTFFVTLRPVILFLDGKGRILDAYDCVPFGRLLIGPRGTRDTLELPSGAVRRSRIQTGSILRFRR